MKATNPIRRAWDNPSRPNAIRGECYECQGGHRNDDPGLNTIKARVRECHINDCPLWAVRPWRPIEQKRADLPQVQCRDSGDPVLAAAAAHPTSLASAIKAQCWECVGRGADTGPKLRVRDCAITTCALHKVRPWVDLKGRKQA